MQLRTITDADEAVDLLRAGGLVALPTETVYGLAADASSEDALARLFSAKGRPAEHPVIVHVASASTADGWAVDVPTWTRPLMDRLWPGPLTLILPRAPHVLDAVTGGQPTVGLRVPDHPLTAQVLERFSGGLAAPSANRYGRVSPTTAAHVVTGLGDVLDPQRDAVLDGGPCQVGVESTIVGAWDDVPRLLRPGAVTATQIAEFAGRQVRLGSGGVRSPGSTASHYAPRARVVVVDADGLGEAASVTTAVRPSVLALREVTVPPGLPSLAQPADAVEYAHVLYAALQRADAIGSDVVLAVPPVGEGVGVAVRDRLRRAASAGDRP